MTITDDGTATLDQMREMRAQVTLRMLKGLDDDELAAKAVREGAQDYLVKREVDTRLLVRSIRYAIARQTADDALRAELTVPPGDVFDLERDRSGRHGRIMKYNLNTG